MKNLVSCIALVATACSGVGLPGAHTTSALPEADTLTFPLFSRFELGDAFSLVLPDSVARRLAGEWFDRYAGPDDTDQQGRFLCDRALFTSESETPGIEPIALSTTPQDSGATRFEPLRTMSDSSLQDWLMSFTDFHLNLLMLVSPELEERVRRFRGDTHVVAARRKAQAEEMVAALRRRQE